MTGKSHDDRTRLSGKVALGEKGLKARRSYDVYLPRGGFAEPAVCKKCRMIYRHKRWHLDEREALQLLAAEGTHTGICPACRRMADDNPGGIVTFTGGYFREHENEILNLIKHVEEKARAKNPLGRIMEIKQEGDLLTVTTTEDKLAQKLGREIFKAHRGELHYKWSHEENLVRVRWER